MDDINIPKVEDFDFHIKEISESRDDKMREAVGDKVIHSVPYNSSHEGNVVVTLGNLVELISNKSVEDITLEVGEEQIEMQSDVLLKLVNLAPIQRNNKLYLLFFIGLFLGGVIVYLLFNG